MALLLMMPICVNAQNKYLQKSIKKEYKNKKKQFEREGWKLFASSRLLDVALLKHYSKLESLGDNGYEVVGICNRAKSDNIAHQTAINNACSIYARNAVSHIKGRIDSDKNRNVNNTASDFNNFCAAYEALVEKEIRGELQESFAVFRDLGNGEKAVQVFFIVNEEAAAKVRIRVFENIAKESDAARKYAQKVRDFVCEKLEGTNE